MGDLVYWIAHEARLFCRLSMMDFLGYFLRDDFSCLLALRGFFAYRL